MLASGLVVLASVVVPSLVPASLVASLVAMTHLPSIEHIWFAAQSV
jgi:hypothetical protein